jgi:hypothetical protein
MRTNTDITIYNKYYSEDDKDYAYLRTVVSDVEWENRKARNVLASGGNIAADQAVIYIPFARGAAYKSPKAWQALDAGDKPDYWTLERGSLIAKGTLTTEITGATTTDTLKNTYDDVLEISSVDTYDMGSLALQHWKVSGK